MFRARSERNALHSPHMASRMNSTVHMTTHEAANTTHPSSILGKKTNWAEPLNTGAGRVKGGGRSNLTKKEYNSSKINHGSDKERCTQKAEAARRADRAFSGEDQ